MHRFARVLTLGALSTLIPAISACGGGGGGSGGGGADGRIEGRIRRQAVAASSLAPRREREPNDSVDMAQPLGEIRPGERFGLSGELGAGESDPFDGYEIRVPVRSRLAVAVRTPEGALLDADVAVLDPTALRPVATFAGGGVLVARGTVTLALRAASGGGAYVLEVSASAVQGPVEAVAGAETFVGDLLPGEEVALAGRAGDAWLVPLPAAAWLEVASGAADLLDATEEGSGSSSVGGPADAGTLCRVVARADGNVVVRARASGRAYAAARVERAGRVAPLALEAAAFRRPGAIRAFGRVRHALSAGKALVAFRPGMEVGGELELQGRGCRIVEVSPSGHAVVAFDVPARLGDEDGARLTVARASSLRAAPSVRYADPSFRRYARAVPNDPRYRDQWHYPLMRLPEAWGVTTGSSTVVVAVIDTGLTDHPDLAGRQSGGYDFVSDVGISGDGNGRDADPTDPGDGEGGEPSSFHGTHVAGTIGAATNNGMGVAGVTWLGSIMHLRVLGLGGYGEDPDIVEAIRYAAGLPNASGRLPTRRADVINMSLGGGGYDQALQDAVTAARGAGVVVCAAAGNSGENGVEYPAAFDGVLAIGAVDRTKARASYSTYGRDLDLVAPGGDSTARESDGVLSTVYDDSGGSPVATYAYYDGTSMATPHAAGVAALVRAVNPSLSAAQVESILLTTAQDLGSPGRDDQFGHGLIDAYAAVVAAGSGTPPPPPPPPPPPTDDPVPGDVDLDVWVLAVDAVTQETVAETVVRAGDDAFSLEGLPPGSYEIWAGTDADDDGYLCDDGDWCGAYGGESFPDVVEVGPGEVVRGVEVVVAPVGG